MFTVSALPASYGDCLWIEYGPDDAPNVILIDAGPSAPKELKARLQRLADRNGELELVVVTHIDADHIGGMLSLLEENFFGVPVRDFWFNGFRHLPGEIFGVDQAERLTNLLLEKGVAWNAVLENEGFMVSDKGCPEFELPGGAKITLLSPDATQLTRLKREWVKVCRDAGLKTDIPAVTTFYGEDGREAFGATPALNIPQLAAEAFEEDDSEANGSSIAFSIEYGSKRVLCGADAYPSRLLSSLKLYLGDPPYQFDLVKLPHHGSRNNVSKAFIQALYCPKYLFSTNGARYKHPDKSAVARVIHHSDNPNLLFNYQSAYTQIWDNQLLQACDRYSVTYGNDAGITVDLGK